MLIPGIKNTTFDTGKKSLVVEYDDSTSGRAITQAIVSDAGYEAKEDMETSDSANEEKEKKQKARLNQKF